MSAKNLERDLMVLEWQGRKEKARKKQENWRLKVCRKIAMEHNFPNNEIIELYLSNNHGHFTGMFAYFCQLRF